MNVPRSESNLLVIKQTKYLVRAVSISDGAEKWNLSLAKNDIIKYPKKLQIDFASNAGSNMFIGYDNLNDKLSSNRLDDVEGLYGF
jgi:hypothetical protein